MTQRCRVCGCSNLSACTGGCWWVEDDLCSSCRGTEPMTVIRFTGCPPSGPDFDIARAMTHDEVIEGIRIVGGRQTGPVRWRTYDPSIARDMLEEAGVWDSPNAPGLIDFLRDHPGTVLMVASVDYEGPGVPRDLS